MKRLFLVVLALFSLCARVTFGVTNDEGKGVVQATKNDASLTDSPMSVANDHSTPHGQSSSLADGSPARKKYKRAPWTEERRAKFEQRTDEQRRAQQEKFSKTIATRTVTDAMREKWSKAHQGLRHTDETKILMAMRKLGSGQLPDSERKAIQRQDKGDRAFKKQRRKISDTAREALSMAAKARWAKVHANEVQQLADDPSERKPSQIRVSMSLSAKERWAKVRAHQQQAEADDAFKGE